MGHVLLFCPIATSDCRGMFEVGCSFFLANDVIPIQSASRWTTQRKAFGKPLHSQAVIRSKLAAMISRVESVQNWLENLTHQMNNMVRLRRFYLTPI